MSGRLVKLDERVIQYFLPILIQNSNSEKKFIKEDSNLALSEFVIACCQTDFAYEIICDKSLDFKAHQLQETSLKLLAKMLQNCNQNITLLKPTTL